MSVKQSRVQNLNLIQKLIAGAMAEIESKDCKDKTFYVGLILGLIHGLPTNELLYVINTEGN